MYSYMGSNTRFVSIWPRGTSRWVIWAQTVYMSPYTLSIICITINIILQYFFLREKYDFIRVLQVTETYLSSPIWSPPPPPTNKRYAQKKGGLIGSNLVWYSWPIKIRNSNKSIAYWQFNIFMTQCSLQLRLCLFSTEHDVLFIEAWNVWCCFK